MIQPIITPIPVKNNVYCIVQEGIKYCEQSQLTNKELGITLLLTVAFFVWLWLCMLISDRILYSSVPGGFFAILFPMLVIGLILVFF